MHNALQAIFRLTAGLPKVHFHEMKVKNEPEIKKYQSFLYTIDEAAHVPDRLAQGRPANISVQGISDLCFDSFMRPAKTGALFNLGRIRNFFIHKRTNMRNVRSEINYCLGDRSLVVSLTNLADLQAGKRGKGDSVWLEARNLG